MSRLEPPTGTKDPLRVPLGLLKKLEYTSRLVAPTGTYDPLVPVGATNRDKRPFLYNLHACSSSSSPSHFSATRPAAQVQQGRRRRPDPPNAGRLPAVVVSAAACARGAARH